jgi:AcrR family transcriptional regulator
MRSRSSSPSIPAARGRPRSQRARRAVLDAVHALVETGGYGAATIDAIAARSGVAKTTIYRWWPNRATLVVDLLVQISSAAAPPPAGSDAIQALRTELRLVAEAAHGVPGRLLISLLGEAERDPDIRTALLHGLFNPRRRATARVIRRAQRSGALRRDVPPLLATDLLYGPLFYRRFVRHEAVNGRFVNEVFESVLAGLLVPRAPRRFARSTGQGEGAESR